MSDTSWLVFEVSGMTCGGCERAVSRALGRMPGAAEAEADVRGGRAWVRLDPARAEEAMSAIVRAGFTVSSWQVAPARPSR
jgi:copper chaperone CopZ